MFEELVASLAKRGVIVSLCGNYSSRRERMAYRADVRSDRFNADKSWPAVAFTVSGRELDELARDIKARLPLVEPIIAALEKHRAHNDAVKKAAQIGKELKDICHPPIEPNTDAKTAKEQPIA